MIYDFEKMIQRNINTDLDKDVFKLLNDIVGDNETIAGVLQDLETQEKRKEFFDLAKDKVNAKEVMMIFVDMMY